MDRWKVIYYTSASGDNPISDFLDSLDKQAQSKLLRIFNYIEQSGLQSVIHHVKKLSGSPFWEIRILGHDNVRTIYVIPTSLHVLILHGFTKKSPKTPLKELATASKRYRQYLLSLKKH